NVVAVYSPADIRFSAIHFGVLMAGGIYTAINPNMDTEEVAQRLEETNAMIVFVAPMLLPRLLASIANSGLQIPASHIILTNGNKTSFSSIDSLDNTAFEPPSYLDVDLANRVAMIMYTSGTSGRPRGVMLTHRNIVAMYTLVGGYSARSQVIDKQPSVGSGKEQGRMLSALPLWQIYGHCVLCYQPLYTGDCAVLMPAFDAVEYLKVIEKYHITRLNATPSIFHTLFTKTVKSDNGKVAIKTDMSQQYDVRSVMAVGCGGAPLPPDRLQQCYEYFNHAPVVIGYGLTECCSVLAGGSWLKPAPGAIGIIYPNSIAKVVDQNGIETDDYGELCISGPHVMKGYLGAQTTEPISADGFLYTGDCARIVADGNVFLKGRMSDVFRTSHGIIYANDVENKLMQHPVVEDTAVVAYDTENGDVHLVAFVVLSSEGSAEQLCGVKDWIGQHIRGADISCRMIPAIPKSQSGKVLRHLLK
ncbi:acetyl-CoA synthetase-like protein, partial [Coemansia reversa NRRL 1564]